MARDRQPVPAKATETVTSGREPAGDTHLALGEDAGSKERNSKGVSRNLAH